MWNRTKYTPFANFCWFSNWKLYAFTFNWYGVIRHSSSADVMMLGLHDKFNVYWRRRDSLALKASNDELLVICIVASSYEINIKKKTVKNLFKRKMMKFYRPSSQRVSFEMFSFFVIFRKFFVWILIAFVFHDMFFIRQCTYLIIAPIARRNEKRRREESVHTTKFVKVIQEYSIA